jgi:hypothetical protein
VAVLAQAGLDIDGVSDLSRPACFAETSRAANPMLSGRLPGSPAAAASPTHTLRQVLKNQGITGG